MNKYINWKQSKAEISFYRKGVLKFALGLIFLLENTSKLLRRNQNYLKATLFLLKLINSYCTFKSSETKLAKFMCFTYSVQYLFGHCLTTPYKRACHQTNISSERFVRKVPLFLFSFIIFSLPVFMYILSFFQGVLWAAGWPLGITGEMRWGVRFSILNKSENATPELFAIYIQNYANQECYWKCILMFKYWVMHNSKKITDVETHESHLNVTGVQFFGLQIWTEISHSLGLQKSDCTKW